MKIVRRISRFWHGRTKNLLKSLSQKMTTYNVYQLWSVNKWKCKEKFVNFDDGRTWDLKMQALYSKDTVIQIQKLKNYVS